MDIVNLHWQSVNTLKCNNVFNTFICLQFWCHTTKLECGKKNDQHIFLLHRFMCGSFAYSQKIHCGNPLVGPSFIHRRACVGTWSNTQAACVCLCHLVVIQTMCDMKCTLTVLFKISWIHYCSCNLMFGKGNVWADEKPKDKKKRKVMHQ